jgi:hypothetical protein
MYPLKLTLPLFSRPSGFLSNAHGFALSVCPFVSFALERSRCSSGWCVVRRAIIKERYDLLETGDFSFNSMENLLCVHAGKYNSNDPM